MWESITEKLSKSRTWLFPTNSQGGRGTTTKQSSELTKPERTRADVSISSDYTSDPREEDWATDDSFKIARGFSDPMSDNLSEEYQTREAARAT